MVHCGIGVVGGVIVRSLVTRVRGGLRPEGLVGGGRWGGDRLLRGLLVLLRLLRLCVVQRGGTYTVVYVCFSPQH